MTALTPDLTALLDEIQADHAQEHPYCTDCPLTRTVAALRAVLAAHVPVDALMNPGRHERVVKVCTGCGTDDGNWQRHPCPTVTAIITALSAVTR